MALDLLRVKQFVAVAEARNVRQAAATNLGITQPTVSRAIISLEREFGCQFLTRNSNGVELTEGMPGRS
jgi:DNA-binding transcriptional LysR family regulator